MAAAAGDGEGWRRNERLAGGGDLAGASAVVWDGGAGAAPACRLRDGGRRQVGHTFLLDLQDVRPRPESSCRALLAAAAAVAAVRVYMIMAKTFCVKQAV